MSRLPLPIQNLIDEFSHLPGIGPKTAERLVFYLLKNSQDQLNQFSDRVKNLRSQITVCQVCQNYSLKSPCEICSDPSRQKDIICIVSRPVDVIAIEKTGEYKGLYHILGGAINPIEGISPENLKIKQLENRLNSSSGQIKEIIIATNSDMEGETTALYLAKLFKPLNINITRLGRGLPVGADVEYADEDTLAYALKGRRQM